VYELCNEGLQAKLGPQREQFKQLEDREAEEASKVRAYFTWHSDTLMITLHYSTVFRQADGNTLSNMVQAGRGEHPQQHGTDRQGRTPSVTWYRQAGDNTLQHYSVHQKSGSFISVANTSCLSHSILILRKTFVYCVQCMLC